MCSFCNFVVDLMYGELVYDWVCFGIMFYGGILGGGSVVDFGLCVVMMLES